VKNKNKITEIKKRTRWIGLALAMFIFSIILIVTQSNQVNAAVGGPSFFSEQYTCNR